MEIAACNMAGEVREGEGEWTQNRRPVVNKQVARVENCSNMSPTARFKTDTGLGLAMREISLSVNRMSN